MNDPLEPQLMTTDTAPLVSALHKKDYLTPQALCYEYFGNPDESRLYYGLDAKSGKVAASQAFVGQTLIRNGEIVPTLMTERTLLAPAFWGRSDYRGFFLWSLTETAQATSAGFVWGGTSALKAFQRYGFDNYDCFVHDALAFRPAAVLRAATAPFSWKSRAFHAALYALSLVKHWLSLPSLRRTPWTVAEEVPADADLAALLQTVSRAHPDSYFMRYTQAKLGWFATGNPYRRRAVVTFRRDGALEGLAIVEDRQDGFATVIDLLVADAGQSAGYLLALARHQASMGRSAMRYWANGQNAYIGKLREGLRRLGGVPLRKVGAHLVLRGPGQDGKAHPPAAALAMTWIWQPPL
jgi:hypothetical protein